MAFFESMGKIVTGILGDDGGKLGNIGGGLGIASEFTSGKTSDGLALGGAGTGLLGSVQGLVQNTKKGQGWGMLDSSLGILGSLADGAMGIFGLTGNEKAAGIARMVSGAVGSLGGAFKFGKSIYDLINLRGAAPNAERTKQDIANQKADAWQRLFGGIGQMFRGVTNIGQGDRRRAGDEDSEAAKNWAIAGKAASIASVIPGLFKSFEGAQEQGIGAGTTSKKSRADRVL